jgi:hypothetical protein
MPLGNPTGGAGYAAEFQSSALPWLTSSIAPASPNPQKIVFGMVTRFIAVTNLSGTGGNNLQLAVTQRGATTSSNVVTILPGQTLWLEWRIAQCWLQGVGGTCNYSLAAGLTTIPPQNFYNITGSAPDGTNWPGVG